MSEAEFFEDLAQEIISRAGAEANFKRTTFLDYMCPHVEAEGVVSGYDLTEHKISAKGQAVDAWSYDDELSRLTLFIGDYRDGGQIESLTNTQISNLFARLRRFLEASLSHSFVTSLEESDPTAALAWHIWEKRNELSSVKLVILSNALLSSRVAELPKEDLAGFSAGYEVWDLGRLYRSEASGKSREDLEINFEEICDGGLPCLPAHTGVDTLKSYLIVMPGKILADLYRDYGERLLEQNVRTFLQFRGKINKGIRNTIMNDPGMFFCYNNGLSATAEAIETADNQARILSVTNLQIVNGGQTTASIFTAHRKDKASLEKVYVQVKLSIIDPEQVEEIVPRISEYSNTQNRVNASDFFSNHPFHLRIEDFSRRLWAPSPTGSVQQTHWFYERTRGQFANQQATLTPAQKKQFLAQNPRSQMFTKTDLAKYILSFDEAPHEVSLGAQKAFAGSPRTKGLVGRVSEQWDKDERQFNEVWFKRAVGKALLFKQLDKAILKQPWYGGYKANIVTYTLAKFAAMARRAGRDIHFVSIWEQQVVPEELMTQLLDIAERINEILTNPPSGVTTNVSEWAKKPGCWEAVEKEALELSPDAAKFLLDHDAKEEIDKEGTRTQVIQDGIQAQTYVLEKGAEYWQRLKEWNMAKKIFSPKEMGILDYACAIPVKFPSEKQAPILIKAERRAREEGFAG